MNGSPVSADDESAVRDVVKRVVAAWAEQDANAFAEIYAENATLVGDAFMRDREHIRSFMKAGFDSYYVGTRLEIEPLTVRFLSQTVACVVTQGGVFIGDETDVPLERRFVATCTMIKLGDSWFMAAYQNAKGMTA